MQWLHQHIRRVLVDAAGYLLLLAALLTGWLPGPGGIPLALAGLGLLSLHNAWARRIKDYFFAHGSDIMHKLFLDQPQLQLAYDYVVVALLVVGGLLAWQHGNRWQAIGAGTTIGLAIGIGLTNRRRYQRIVARLKRKR